MTPAIAERNKAKRRNRSKRPAKPITGYVIQPASVCYSVNMSDAGKNNRVQVSVRLPQDLYEQLKATAQAQHRNLGEQAAWYITRGLAADKETP